MSHLGEGIKGLARRGRRRGQSCGEVGALDAAMLTSQLTQSRGALTLQVGQNSESENVLEEKRKGKDREVLISTEDRKGPR